MTRAPLLPLPDYQRIYQVIYSVLQASEIALTHRACFFFASVGTLLLREHYHLPATFSVGCMALMVNEADSKVVVYGRQENDTFVVDEQGFHAWVECNGWLVDFMAPIMGMALMEDGHAMKVPRRMLQKPLAAGKGALAEIEHEGDFYIDHEKSLAESILDSQGTQYGDLLHVCRTWFSRPPKQLRQIAIADSHGPTKRLVAQAPSIDGVW